MGSPDNKDKERTKQMAKTNKKELLKWVVDYHYGEDDGGIGSCEAKIAVRETDMKAVFDGLTTKDKKWLMCSLIEKVGYPCEDYADDFDDEDSAFGYTCKYDGTDNAIRFYAEFRV